MYEIEVSASGVRTIILIQRENWFKADISCFKHKLYLEDENTEVKQSSAGVDDHRSLPLTIHFRPFVGVKPHVCHAVSRSIHP